MVLWRGLGLYLGQVKLLGLTGRVGKHQARNVAANRSQTGGHSTGQDAKLTEKQNTQGMRSATIIHVDYGACISFLHFIYMEWGCLDTLCSPYLARVVSFELNHLGLENCSADPGLSNMVAQFRHTDDARLHQTPAWQINKYILVVVLLYHWCFKNYRRL